MTQTDDPVSCTQFSTVVKPNNFNLNLKNIYVFLLVTLGSCLLHCAEWCIYTAWYLRVFYFKYSSAESGNFLCAYWKSHFKRWAYKHILWHQNLFGSQSCSSIQFKQVWYGNFFIGRVYAILRIVSNVTVLSRVLYIYMCLKEEILKIKEEKLIGSENRDNWALEYILWSFILIRNCLHSQLQRFKVKPENTHVKSNVC